MNEGIRVDFAVMEDLKSWMDLARLVKDNFPGLDTEEQLNDYQNTVTKNMQRGSAICAKWDRQVVGVLLFSKNRNLLSCMAVHPNYRRHGIATEMMNLMMTQLSKGRDVVVSTFRHEDVKGIAPRALYKKFGFVEDELGYEFDYPHQKFVLHSSDAD